MVCIEQKLISNRSYKLLKTDHFHRGWTGSASE